jgi:membrane protein
VIARVWQLCREAVDAWLDDDAASMGAALAFYTLFSIAPLLLIVISVAGLAFGRQAARGEILNQLSSLLGADSALTVQSLLDGLNRPRAGLLGTTFGIAALIVGATTVVGELQSAMDRIWRAPPRQSHGPWLLVRTRLLSIGLVLGVGFLLIVSLLVSAALAALGAWWAPWFADVALTLQAVNFGVSFAFVATVFAMIFKWLPRVPVAWRDVWFGAAVTALLYTCGKLLIGLYIGSSGVASVFGAAASLVVLLLWVYYSAQIFLLGAEFTSVYAHRYGSLRTKPRAPVAPLSAEAPAHRVDAR